MAAFAAAGGAGPATQNFEGRLTLTLERRARDFRVILDQYGLATANGGAATHLPAFDFDFIQDGANLIPARRGAIPSTNPAWEFILEPGRVWNEPGDAGFTRAALPFTLEERNANCMHNGVLTFLFRSDGAMSDVAYEIAQETCAYFQFVSWGYYKARYAPGRIDGHDAIVTRHRAEVAGRLPVRALSTLASVVEGADPAQFGSSSDVPPQTLTTFGLIVDGVHYSGGCLTRFGAYPFCEEIDLPSYSLAKSIAAAVGTFRLAMLYPELPDTRIASLVPECGQWDGVTVRNALDMATGRFQSAVAEQDEGAADILPFFLAESHAERIRFSCRHYPQRQEPGQSWVYHTPDTYVVGTALNAFYRGKTTAQADYYQDLLAGDLWPKLRLNPAIDVTRRSYDAARQPFSGFGLTLHADDMAKLALFLARDGGRLGDQPMLDAPLLAAAMQRMPSDRGLKAGSEDVRYQHGFWAWNAQAALGCSAPAWIPFMSGFGGIIVAMFPNDLIYYYVSDGGVFRWAHAAAEANRLRPFCKR